MDWYSDIFNKSLENKYYFYIEEEAGFPHKIKYFDFFLDYAMWLGLNDPSNIKLGKKILDDLCEKINKGLYYNHNVVIGLEIYKKLGRVVKSNESIYHIFIIDNDFRTSYKDFYIPQIELFKFLNDKMYCSLFLNLKRFYNDFLEVLSSKWFHGTRKADKVISINDLDPNKGIEFGDFGRGSYITKDVDMARSYELDWTGLKAKNSALRMGHWYNNELDYLYYKALAENFKKKGKVSFDWNIRGKNGKYYRVRVFTKDSKEWRKAIWDGWIDGKIISGYDMVLGPVSSNKIVMELREIRIVVQINNNSDEEKNLETNFLLANRKDLLHRDKKDSIIYQLCIYNPEILDRYVGNFIMN